MTIVGPSAWTGVGAAAAAMFSRTEAIAMAGSLVSIGGAQVALRWVLFHTFRTACRSTRG